MGDKAVVVRILRKHDMRARRRLCFHDFLGLKKDEPIGVSLHIMDGDTDIWTDPSEFVPLNGDTREIIEEIQSLEEQREGLEAEIASLYKRLERFLLARPWH